MSEHTDCKNCITRQEYKKDIDRINERLTENEKDIVAVKNTLSSMEYMPKSLRTVENTVTRVEETVKRIDEKVDYFVEKQHKKDKEQNEKIDAIDEKSKFDIMKWIKENWFSIAVAIITFIVVGKELIK